jgi:hypothetical protein
MEIIMNNVIEIEFMGWNPSSKVIGFWAFLFVLFFSTLFNPKRHENNSLFANHLNLFSDFLLKIY